MVINASLPFFLSFHLFSLLLFFLYEIFEDFPFASAVGSEDVYLRVNTFFGLFLPFSSSKSSSGELERELQFYFIFTCTSLQ